MDRIVLIAAAVVLSASSARAQRDPRIDAYEELAREMDENDWPGALVAARAVLHGTDDTSELRSVVECMHAFLLEMQLQTSLASTPHDLASARSALSALSHTVRELLESTSTCGLDAQRRLELTYLQPRLDRAAELSAAASSSTPSPELEQVFVDEHRELVAAITPAPSDRWERARSLWAAQHLPEARPREWPARGEAPAIGTAVLIAGFGLVSFASTLTALSGRGLPSLSAGGWGITFSLIPAFAAAWTWEKPTRALLFASLTLTAIAAGGGVAAIARLGRDGRYFGRGLLIGSAVSVMWQVGGWIHHRYPERAQRGWRERVRIAPAAGRRFAGLSASGTF